MSTESPIKDVDIVPGTEVMKDVGDQHFVRAGGKGSVLVPQPAENVNDPLNWSTSWKLTTAASQLLYVWVLVSSALSLAPLFPLLGMEFHLNQQQLSLLTGLNVITLGFANVLIVPISNIFGRRATSIFGGVLCILTNVWQALASSHKSLLAARACNGIVAATSETIMVQTIADMFFLHERGFWMGIYFVMYFSGSFLGPIMAGNIGQAHGWRSFFWLSTALSGAVTIGLVLFYPETKWHRSANSAPITKAESKEAAAQERSVDSEAESAHGEGEFLGRGKPSKTQYGLIQKPDARWKTFVIRDFTTPLLVFFNPICFWAALNLAGPADLLLLFNLTESGLFSSPAYNWSPGTVGYSNFAFFIGGVIGAVTAGPFSDWIARRSTIKNNGIREPEMRLPALIPFVCFFIVSHIVGAVGYQRLWPWQAILVCGFGFSGLAVTSIPAISLAYAIDCYKPISGEIMVVATVLKNVLGFCLSYWVFNIAMSKGFTTVYMIQFAVSMFPLVFTPLLYIYGKSLRRWTKDSVLHRMENLI